MSLRIRNGRACRGSHAVPPAGAVDSRHARAEREATPSLGNAHPNPQRYPIRFCFGWVEMPIHFHPKPIQSPSKAHPKRLCMGSRGAETIHTIMRWLCWRKGRYVTWASHAQVRPDMWIFRSFPRSAEQREDPIGEPRTVEHRYGITLVSY